MFGRKKVMLKLIGMMKLLKNKLFWVLLVLFGLTGQAGADVFKADEFFLENGLHVVVIENHKAPIIKHMVWYDVGAVNDGLGKSGRAHLLEHLMFRGTQSVPDGMYNAVMDENGIESNAFTSYDMTVYHQFADISKLELLMALEADRMYNLDFDQRAFETEQKIVFQERKQVVENKASAPFKERQKLLLWGNHPYGHPITGSDHEIMSLTYEDIREFYQKYYMPNYATLILSGDIDVETAKNLAQKYYGSIPQKKVAREKILSSSPSDFQEFLKMKLEHVQTPSIVNKYLLPASKLQDYYAWDVAITYLGQGRASALYQDLVVRRKKVLTLNMNYMRMKTGDAVVTLSMRPQNADESEIQNILEAVQPALQRAQDELTVDRLEQVKRKLLADLIYENDDPEESAYLIGYLLSVGFSLQEIQDYEKHIRNVKLEEVQNAIKILSSASVVEGVLLPKQESN